MKTHSTTLPWASAAATGKTFTTLENHGYGLVLLGVTSRMKSRALNLSWCVAAAALAFLSETGIRAQIGGVPLWTNYFRIPGFFASARGMAVDASGNVFVTGFTGGDFATIKYSGAGVPLWTNRFNGPGHSVTALRIAVDSNGNAFVTGRSIGSRCATIKYSGAGVPLWTNYLTAFATGGIAVDNDGKVFVAATTADYASPAGDSITTAYSNTGVPLWTNYYNGPGNDHIRSIAVDRGGNVVVTGVSDRHFATIKYSGAGVALWTNRYVAPPVDQYDYDFANAVVVDGSGNAFVTGSSSYNGGATINYSSAGVGLWTNVFTGGSLEAAALDSSGNVYVAGSAFNNGSNDFLTLKYSGAGVPLWTNRYNGLENVLDFARSIAMDAGGNVFVSGDSVYNDGGDAFFLSFTTVAYSSGGVPLWTNRYESPSGSDYASAISCATAVDGSGNVFVFGGTSDRGYVTIKYSSALPRLTFSRTATNRVIVWPSSLTGFTLQEKTDLNQASNWRNVSAGVQDDGTNKTFIVSPVSGNRFYRLTRLVGN